MASGAQGPKQTRGYFVPLANCIPSMLQYTPGSGAGGSYLPGSFNSADWAGSGANGAGKLLSSISSVGAGGLLRDMGKTVVSSNRTFRKVQLMVPSNVANGGVAGPVGAGTSALPYLTGYIELATGLTITTNAAPAPVAYLPGLL